jgi:hypothetical protein
MHTIDRRYLKSYGSDGLDKPDDGARRRCHAGGSDIDGMAGEKATFINGLADFYPICSS